MSTTITWKIAELERTTSDGIVYNAHYTVNATNGTYRAGAYGSLNLEPPLEGDPVIPFSDLTEAVVVGWVQDYLGAEKVAEIEAALQGQIEEQQAPTTAKGTPW